MLKGIDRNAAGSRRRDYQRVVTVFEDAWGDPIADPILTELRSRQDGNAVAFREVWDSVDGKVRQDVAVDTNLHAEIVRKLQAVRLRAGQLDASRLADEKRIPE